jgi:hypothetical protein
LDSVVLLKLLGSDDDKYLGPKHLKVLQDGLAPFWKFAVIAARKHPACYKLHVPKLEALNVWNPPQPKLQLLPTKQFRPALYATADMDKVKQKAMAAPHTAAETSPEILCLLAQKKPKTQLTAP